MGARSHATPYRIQSTHFSEPSPRRHWIPDFTQFLQGRIAMTPVPKDSSLRRRRSVDESDGFAGCGFLERVIVAKNLRDEHLKGEVMLRPRTNIA